MIRENYQKVLDSIEAARARRTRVPQEEPVTLAKRLIRDEGCGMPEKLFLALHTVSEHLKEV